MGRVSRPARERSVGGEPRRRERGAARSRPTGRPAIPGCDECRSQDIHRTEYPRFPLLGGWYRRPISRGITAAICGNPGPEPDDPQNEIRRGITPRAGSSAPEGQLVTHQDARRNGIRAAPSPGVQQPRPAVGWSIRPGGADGRTGRGPPRCRASRRHGPWRAFPARTVTAGAQLPQRALITALPSRTAVPCPGPLGHPVEQSVERREHRLVVLGGRVAAAADDALAHGAREAFEGAQHRCGSPGSGHALHRHRRAARHPDTPVRGACRPSGAPAGRADLPARATSAAPGQAVCHGAAAAKPTQADGRGSPGTSVTLRPGKRLAELLEERGRDLERLGKRPVPQLDRVPEQHHLVSRLEPVDQPRADLRPAEQVRPRCACPGEDQR